MFTFPILPVANVAFDEGVGVGTGAPASLAAKADSSMLDSKGAANAAATEFLRNLRRSTGEAGWEAWFG